MRPYSRSMEMDHEGMAKRSCKGVQLNRQGHMSYGEENVWPQGSQEAMMTRQQQQMAYGGQVIGGQGDMEMDGFGSARRGQCDGGMAGGYSLQGHAQQQWPIAQVYPFSILTFHLCVHYFLAERLQRAQHCQAWALEY